MEDPELDDEAAAMAQAMGFSAFGSQTSGAKRRKYNPRADSSADDGSVPLHEQDHGSGSNMTPLGAPRALANEAEIALDGDDDEGGDSGPQYVDTSRPATVTDDAQAKIDAILAVTATPPATEPTPTAAAAEGGRGGGRGGRAGARGGGRGPQQRREGRSEKWWEDYYDPSSNVNPWEKLEKKLGLAPRGSWLAWEESKAGWEAVKAANAADAA